MVMNKLKEEYKPFLLQIKENVQQVDAEAQVWLYGSRARGDARSDSDWDILVLSPKDKLTFKEEEKYMDNICGLMVETGQVIQLFAYGMLDWHQNHKITPFYQSVKSDAIQL